VSTEDPVPDLNDPVLRPFLQAPDTGEAAALLEALIANHAEPLVSRIVRGKLRFDQQERQDADDVRGEIMLQLVTCLQSLKGDSDADAIGDFARYVAVTSYHACHDYVRRRHPNRWRLKNRLRYLLAHDSQFELVEDPTRGWLCGLAASRRDAPPARATRPAAGDYRALVCEAFRQSGEPIALDSLVDVVAAAAGIGDPIDPPPRPGGARAPLEERLERQPDAASALEARSFLLQLWREILVLPPRQRSALILGLRAADGGDALALLPAVGIASIRQIAAAVDMPADELARIWPDLPFEDARIAELFGVTRQQVVNLRKSARARLARRMAGR
jgi:DNA-directed RNA polymerase specialized sigma24 family protein